MALVVDPSLTWSIVEVILFLFELFLTDITSDDRYKICQGVHPGSWPAKNAIISSRCGGCAGLVPKRMFPTVFHITLN
jgi:hypothetical protein